MIKPLTIDQAAHRKWTTSAKKTWWYQKLAATRRRKLVRLSEQQGHRCCYCEQLTWMFDQIKESSLPHYWSDRLPGMGKRAMATLEHLVTTSAGGTEHNSNLIMCCDRCNNLRGHYVSAMEFWEIMHDPVRFQHFIEYTRRSRHRRRDPVARALHREKRRAKVLQTTLGLAALCVLSPQVAFAISAWSAWLEQMLQLEQTLQVAITASSVSDQPTVAAR